jgi:hypothetical protein
MLFGVLAAGIAHCTESGCTDGGFIGEVISWLILAVPAGVFFLAIWFFGTKPWERPNKEDFVVTDRPQTRRERQAATAAAWRLGNERRQVSAKLGRKATNADVEEFFERRVGRALTDKELREIGLKP